MGNSGLRGHGKNLGRFILKDKCNKGKPKKNFKDQGQLDLCFRAVTMRNELKSIMQGPQIEATVIRQGSYQGQWPRNQRNVSKLDWDTI